MGRPECYSDTLVTTFTYGINKGIVWIDSRRNLLAELGLESMMDADIKFLSSRLVASLVRESHADNIVVSKKMR